MAKRALIVWGGWQGHQPQACAEMVRGWLVERGYDVTVSDTLDSFTDGALMGACDLVVPMVSMGRITEAQWAGLDRAVHAGCGLGAFHGGALDAFGDCHGYRWMVGGQFVAHPGDKVDAYEVTVVDIGHEVVRDLPDFTLRHTEQYYVHVDPAVEVLCATVFSGEHGDATRYRAGAVMPYAWTKRWGAGRVFVACWGHGPDDFTDPTARAVAQRGLVWATR